MPIIYNCHKSKHINEEWHQIKDPWILLEWSNGMEWKNTGEKRIRKKNEDVTWGKLGEMSFSPPWVQSAPCRPSRWNPEWCFAPRPCKSSSAECQGGGCQSAQTPVEIGNLAGCGRGSTWSETHVEDSKGCLPCFPGLLQSVDQNKALGFCGQAASGVQTCEQKQLNLSQFPLVTHNSMEKLLTCWACVKIRLP